MHAILNQETYARGQILTTCHTVSYAEVHFSCPYLYEANHSVRWEHVDNLSFLIPPYSVH